MIKKSKRKAKSTDVAAEAQEAYPAPRAAATACRIDQIGLDTKARKGKLRNKHYTKELPALQAELVKPPKCGCVGIR